MKDRVALEIIQEALAQGRLAPGGLVTEGTVGSTGVSLAMCAAANGCRAFIAMPDDAAIEKAQMLQVRPGLGWGGGVGSEGGARLGRRLAWEEDFGWEMQARALCSYRHRPQQQQQQHGC